MKNSYKLTTVGATLFLAAISSRGQSTDNLYLDINAGGALQQKIAIKNGTGFASSGDIHFDAGFRAGLELGYNICDSFAVELDAGVIQNTINQIGTPLSGGAKAQLDEIPFLVNGIYKFPLKSNFKPYVGLGVGGVAGIFDSSNVPGSFFPGASPKYNATDFVFAYQAELGFKYSMGKHVDLGLAYKFTGTTDHSWTDNNINLKTDGTMTHSLEATFNWRF